MHGAACCIAAIRVVFSVLGLVFGMLVWVYDVAYVWGGWVYLLRCGGLVCLGFVLALVCYRGVL